VPGLPLPELVVLRLEEPLLGPPETVLPWRLSPGAQRASQLSAVLQPESETELELKELLSRLLVRQPELLPSLASAFPQLGQLAS
jgi:hypothetical protein